MADTKKAGATVLVAPINYNTEQAAAALGVSRAVLYQMIHMEGFPSYCEGTRRMIPRRALEKWARKRAMELGPAGVDWGDDDDDMPTDEKKPLAVLSTPQAAGRKRF